MQVQTSRNISFLENEGVFLFQGLGCDGVVGSGMMYDDCGVCGGDNSTCGLVSGLFTKPHLPPGYSHITTIPKDACSITVRLARHTSNHAGIYYIDTILSYHLVQL